MKLSRDKLVSVFAEILVNFLLPYLLYRWASPHYGDVKALLASMAPPMLWSIFEFIRRRRIDAVSLLVLGGIVLSLLAFIGGGSAKFLQLRENIVTGLVALVFLVSAAIKKPVIYYLAHAGQARESPDQAHRFSQLRGKPHFEKLMMTMTLVWGFGLLLQTLAACVLVYLLPIATYLIVSPMLGYGTMGALGLWTFWTAKKARQKAQRP